jgi:thioester reductase-like protein
VVPRPGAAVPAAGLRRHLARSLPGWMLPQRYEVVDRLPRTASGKVDLAALAVCSLRAAPAAGLPVDAGAEARVLADLWRRVLGVEAVGPDDDFFALGGDSLAVLEVAAAAEAQGLLLSPSAIVEYPTVAGLVAWLRRSGANGDEAGALSATWLRYDAGPGPAWTELLAAARRRPPLSPDPPRSILLTGGTGFLGARLLHELLERTEATVYCLVRAAGATAAWERLLAALRGHGKALSPGQGRRLVAVPGELGAPCFGLPAAEWDRLAAEIDMVYHCAAQVHMVLPYAALRAANVAGTAEVLRFACTAGRKRLHHASTLSVFVATDRNTGVLEEADGLSRTRWVYGGYAQTKWAAEWLLRACADAAGPACCYRLGLITGDSRTGYCSETDFLSLFCRGLAALGCVPREAGGLCVDVTPVDYAAAALAHLSLHAAPAGELATFHVANPRSLPLGELVEGLGAYGLALEWVPAEEWRRRLAERADTLGPAEAAACLALCRCPGPGDAFARHRTLDLFQATDVRFDMTRTLAGLAGSGLACPPPGPELLQTYFGYIFRERSAGGRAR